MINRKVIDSMKSTIDAAALQSDMAMRYKLPGAMIRKVSHNGSNKGSSVPRAGKAASNCYTSSSSTQLYCSSCHSSNSQFSRICTTCGYFLNSALQSSDTTLAERRGLVQAAPKVKAMVESEWDAVECSLAGRNDAFCPICMEGFKDGREVLLSCSHMFHHHCLSSFEKFMKTDDKCCPVCRGTKYQKRITRQGSKAFEIICSIKIQKLFRGYIARKEFYFNIRSYYQKGKGGSSQHKTKFYEKELSSYLSKIDDDFHDRKRESDSIISSVDQTLQDSRDLDLLFDNMLRQRTPLYLENKDEPQAFHSLSGQDTDRNTTRNTIEEQDYWEYSADSKCSTYSESKEKYLTEKQWQDILCRAEERGFGQCAICMSDNTVSATHSHALAPSSSQLYTASGARNTPSHGRPPLPSSSSSSSTVASSYSSSSSASVSTSSSSLSSSLTLGPAPCLNRPRGGQRQLLLLSCSHVFHRQCVLNFEDFLADSDRRACPVCRCCGYSKKDL